MPEDMNALLQKIATEQARQGEQIKTLFNNVNDMKKLTESVYDLAASVKLLTSAQKTTEQKVDDLSDDMESIKSKPAKRWDSVVSLVITAVVTAFITYALTRMGLK